MKTARIVVLTIALGAGGTAAAKPDTGRGQMVKPAGLHAKSFSAAIASNRLFRGDAARHDVPNSSTTLNSSKGRPI